MVHLSLQKIPEVQASSGAESRRTDVGRSVLFHDSTSPGRRPGTGVPMKFIEWITGTRQDEDLLPQPAPTEEESD